MRSILVRKDLRRLPLNINFDSGTKSCIGITLLQVIAGSKENNLYH